MMKKVVIFVFIFLASLSLASCQREAKYEDSLKIGVAEIPKNLNPYVSTLSANTYISSMIYDTLLGTVTEPSDPNIVYPDGTKYEEASADNYFNFTDNLVYLEGAYLKKEGSIYGLEYYEPTKEEYEQQLKKKNIVYGYDEIGNAITESEEEFVIRRERAVPSHNWMRYRFKVNDSITWSDGTKFTADDIVFTFKYALKYSGAIAQVAYFLDNHFNCYNDNGDFVLELASNKLSDIKTICSSIYIIPEHIWSNITRPNYEKNLNPIGTGLYTVKEGDYIEDQAVTLTLREDLSKEVLKENFYYEPITHIMLMRLSNEEIMLNSLANGDIDVYLDSIKTLKAESLENNPSYEDVLISAGQNEFVTTLAFNVGKKGIFKDENFNGNAKTIREAISLAIDQEILIKDVLSGKGQTVGDGLVQFYYEHALKDEAGNYLAHETNIAKANALLDSIGYLKNAKGLRDLEFTVLASQSNEALVRRLGEMLEENIGIKLNYEMATSTYSEDIKQANGADFDLIINTVTFAEDKLLMFDARFGVYSTGSPRTWNVTGVYDEVLSDLMYEMDTTINMTEQLELSKKVQAQVASLYVEVPLFCEDLQYVYTTKKYIGFINDKSGQVLNELSYKFLRRK